MSDFTFIFSGGSITDGVWPSWKDFVISRYGIKNPIINAFAGVGNEFLTYSTINHCKQVSNPYALVMLTNIDKWDWYVSDEQLAHAINTYEKHPLRSVTGKKSDKGFWGTGSWFPEYKEYYHNYYYSEEYFVAETLKNIYTLQTFFAQKNIPNLIMFDSPVIETTEQLLNTGKIIKKDLVTNNALAQIWFSLINWDNIYLPGLIGFCEENNLKWFNVKQKGHPPISSHWEFAQELIFPTLDQTLQIVSSRKPVEVINRFQDLFDR